MARTRRSSSRPNALLGFLRNSLVRQTGLARKWRLTEDSSSGAHTAASFTASKGDCTILEMDSKLTRTTQADALSESVIKTQLHVHEISCRGDNKRAGRDSCVLLPRKLNTMFSALHASSFYTAQA